MNTNEELISVIEDTAIGAYQDVSMLGDFEPVPIGDEGITYWFHKNFDNIPNAALTRAGFNPQEAKLSAKSFNNEVLTAGLKIVVSQKDWATFKRIGLDKEGVIMAGAKMGQTATLYLWRGQDYDGNTPVTQYNFIQDAGTGDGALNRPLITSHATAGGWSTFSNKAADLSLLEAQLVDKGYNLATTVVYYPQVAHKPMTVRGSAANEISAKQYLLDDGVADVRPIPNAYMQTLADAAPTAILFDLIAIDHSQIKIGYTVEETVNVILPHNDVRETEIEAEVWFAPYLVPRPMDDGTIVKGVSRITAIAP